jgi:hypothetical protein
VSPRVVDPQLITGSENAAFGMLPAGAGRTTIRPDAFAAVIAWSPGTSASGAVTPGRRSARSRGSAGDGQAHGLAADGHRELRSSAVQRSIGKSILARRDAAIS